MRKMKLQPLFWQKARFNGKILLKDIILQTAFFIF